MSNEENQSPPRPGPPERPGDHPATLAARIGVLVINLGTPDAPEPQALKRYLRQFLSDRRVIEIPPLLWQPILRGIILNTRPRKSAKAYAKVWMDHGSPLAHYTRLQAEALQARLGDDVIVDWAMRYGQPSISGRIEALKSAGCERILALPLYPQYSNATTASVHDALFDAIRAYRWQPALRIMRSYHDDPLYVQAVAASVRASLTTLDFTPDALVASFHGMPKRTLFKGDPYHCHCQKSARLISEALGMELFTSFQSRFGPDQWLEPATDDMLAGLARAGKTKIAIFAPGFSSDCVETLEELAIEGREQFEAAGGERFAYLPCLNADEPGMAMLEGLARRELGGWL
jgi:ferrochelatase